MAKVQHTCTGCVPIDASIIEVYTQMVSTTARAEKAAEHAEQASLGMAPYIGENGNWWEWDETQKTYVDTGVQAATGMVVDDHLSNSSTNPAQNRVVTSALSGKQETLVSGENIKTIGGQSILGSGNIQVGDENAVKFTEQSLSSGQQTQARTNIGAGTYSKPGSGIPASDLASGVIPDISGKQDTITTVNVSVDSNTGTPSGEASVSGGTMSIALHNLKGATGETGATGATPAFSIGTVTTGGAGTSAAATITGTAAAPVLNLTIPKGDQGNTGSSVDYPYELVNNVTTNDATKGLSAAMGVQLESEIAQLDEKVNRRITETITHPYTDATIHGLPNYQTGIIDTSVPSSYKCSDYIDITDATEIVYTNLFPMQMNPDGNKWTGLALYDENYDFVESFAYNEHGEATSGTVDLTDYPTAKYMIFAPYYDSQGVVDTSAKIEITYLLGHDDLLYESNIADNYLGGQGKALSADKGKELHESVEQIEGDIYKKLYEDVNHHYTDATVHGLPLYQTGVIDTSIPDSYKCSDYIDLTNATEIVYTNLFPAQHTEGNPWSGLVLYDENHDFVESFAYNYHGIQTSGTIDLADYPTAKYMVFAPYYDSNGVVDTSANVKISYLIGDDELLFKSNIADDFLGGEGKALSADKGKELYELIADSEEYDASTLDTQSYYIAARYQYTPNGGMIQRKTDVETLFSKQIAVKCGDRITLKTTSTGTAWAYYITDKYGIILGTNGTTSYNATFDVDFSNAAYLCVNLLNGQDFALSIVRSEEKKYIFPESPFVLLQGDSLKSNSGNWDFGNVWAYSANGATPPATGNTNWMRNKSRYYSDMRTMRVSAIMGANTALMLTMSYDSGITDGEGASAFCIDFANAKIKMYGVPTYNYETGDAQPTSNGVDLNEVAEEVAIPSAMIGARKYIIEVKKQSTASIVTLYDTLTGQSVTAKHDGWFVGRQNRRYGFYCVSGTLPTLSDFMVYSINEPDVLFVGDSITEGVYVPDRMQRYAELFRQSHPWKRVVISAGGGQTITDMMPLFTSEWNIMRPKIVSLLIGANGGNTQSNLADFKAACDAIGAKLYIHYMTCIASGRAENTNGTYLPALGYPGARFDIATAENNAPNSGWTNYASGLYGDAGIHPNIEGQKEMYKRLAIDVQDLEGIEIS